MAFYPIVDGQKPKAENAIPPRNAEPSHVQPTTSDESSKAPPPKAPAATEPPQDDLIDFGQDEEPKHEQAEKQEQPEKQQSEIEKMLSSTGKPPAGPLLDFTQDLKKDLPSGS